jgi:thiol-disulfide isomerase/thioredoxin
MRTKTFCLTAVIVLTCAVVAGESWAADPVRDELKAIQRAVQKKAERGARTAAGYAEELARLDALLMDHWDEPEAAGAVMLAQADLYAGPLRDPAMAEAILQRLRFSFGATDAAAQAEGMVDGYREQALGRGTGSGETLVAASGSGGDVKTGLGVGQRFPDFKVDDLDGAPLSVSGLRGKVVLIDFWATWCGPCVAEIPNVARAYQKYQADGFEVVGISLDQDRAALENFVRQRGVAWPQYFDGDSGTLARRYGIRSIPSTFLLDREGIIVARGLRGSALDRAVAQALAR